MDFLRRLSVSLGKLGKVQCADKKTKSDATRLRLEKKKKTVTTPKPADDVTANTEDDGGAPVEAAHVLRSATLRDLIETDFGLTQELFGDGLLTLDQLDYIRSGETGPRRADRLIECVRSWPSAERLLGALRSTGQEHVANFIECGEDIVRCCAKYGPCRPLQQTHLDLIRSCYKKDGALYVLDPSVDLINQLLAVGCITSQHRDHVMAGSNDLERNTRLFGVIQKRSVGDFESFLACLERADQRHVAELIRKEVVVANVRSLLFLSCPCVHSSYSSSCSSIATRSTASDSMVKCSCVDHCDDEVEQEFRNLRQLIVPDERRKVELLRGLAELRRQLEFAGGSNESDLDLVSLRKSTSVAVRIVCRSSAAVRRLDEMCSDGSLAEALRRFYGLLLNCGRHGDNGGRGDIVLKEVKLEWKVSDYNRCLQHFYRSQVSLYAGIEDVLGDVETEESSNLTNAHLPLELLEAVLLKAAVLAYKHFNRLTSRGDILTSHVLCAVCRQWWLLLTKRPYNKRLLRHTQRYLTRPFRVRSEMKISFRVEDKDGRRRPVYGVAALNNKVYIVSNASSVISVYDIDDQYRLAESIDVVGLESPRDVVASVETGKLYITDWNNTMRIWRVNCCVGVDGMKSADIFISTVDYEPWSLSVTSRRLLVTSYRSLHLHDLIEGTRLKDVALPSFMNAEHAAETTRQTFIVCHVGWSRDDVDHQQVSEVDGDGRVLRSYGGRDSFGCQLLTRPRYVIVDVSGKILVADGGGNRIVQLDSALRLERLLLTRQQDKVDGIASRMSYDLSSGKLFVGLWWSGRVNVYCI